MLSDAALVGQTLQGVYVVEEKIAKGGMAWIYRATHNRLGGQVAIKILFANHADNKRLRERFIQEARLQYKLQHPNIVRVLDFIEEEEIVGFVLEWCAGGDLEHWLEQQGGKLKPSQLRDMFLPIVDALHYAHEAGIIHRDLKPPNILLFPTSGQTLIPKLSDFGIAKILDEEGPTRTGSILGTLHYLAPEQLHDSKQVDRRTDVYALGVILYRLACGRLPFEGDTHSLIYQLITKEPPPLIEAHPSLRPIILRCMQKAPNLRYSDAKSLYMELSALLQDAERLDRETKVLPLTEDIALLPTMSSEVENPLPTSATHSFTPASSMASAPLSPNPSPLPEPPLPTGESFEERSPKSQQPALFFPILSGVLITLLGGVLGFGWLNSRSKTPVRPPFAHQARTTTTTIPQPPHNPSPTQQRQTPIPPARSKIPKTKRPQTTSPPRKRRHNRPKRRHRPKRSNDLSKLTHIGHPSFVPRKIDLAILHDIAYYNYNILRKHEKGALLYKVACEHGFALSCSRLAFVLKNKGKTKQALQTSKDACRLGDVFGCWLGARLAQQLNLPKQACSLLSRSCFTLRLREHCKLFQRIRCPSTRPFPKTKYTRFAGHLHRPLTGRNISYPADYDDIGVMAVSNKKANRQRYAPAGKWLHYACQKGSLFSCKQGKILGYLANSQPTPNALQKRPNEKNQLPKTIDLSAHLALAYRYSFTYMNPPQFEKGKELFRKGCETHRFGPSCYHLGRFFQYKKNDKNKAVHYYTLGCQHNSYSSCYQAKNILFRHLGGGKTLTPQEKKLGCRLLKKTCFQFLHRPGCFQYKRHCNPQEKLPSKFRYIYPHSASNHPLSGRQVPYPKKASDLAFIGLYYHHPKRDLSLGLRFLQAACQKGSAFACGRLR